MSPLRICAIVGVCTELSTSRSMTLITDQNTQVNAMLGSLRSRIMLATVGTVLLTTFTVMYFVQRGILDAMLRAQDQNAQNLLNTVVLNVENEYRSLQFHREASLTRRKIELKNTVTLAMGHIEHLHEQQQTGKLPLEDARQQAIEVIRRMRYDNGVGYLWINDMGTPIPRMIMHPTRR